jgi:hypothetical protein
MRKTSPCFLLLLLAAALLPATIFADTVVLSTGERISGRILSETDAEVRIETSEGGIVDERVIPRGEVASIQRQTPDALAWERLAQIKLGANSLPSAASYETFIAPLKAFAAQFPESKHRETAERIAAEFEVEKKRVAEGEIKLNGAWLSKEQAQRERYQIHGAIAFNYLRDQATRGDLIGALNTFDVLERQYNGSSGYLDAVEYVRRMLPAVKQQADARLATLPGENAERERGVKAAAGLSKKQLQDELDNEKRKIEMALADAKRTGLKWPPFLPRSLDAMKTISALGATEAARLAAIDVPKGRRSIELATQAREAIAGGNPQAAEEALRQARELWAQNEILTRLDKELADLRAAGAASPSPEPAPAAAQQPPASATADAPPAAKDAASSAQTSAGPDPTPGPLAPDASSPANLPLRVVLTIIIAALAFTGYKAYRNVRQKANEVIE